jgi:3-hydroxyisobutyrate dehydrogenase-like beta-hydroxyacid dehydrogenase
LPHSSSDLLARGCGRSQLGMERELALIGYGEAGRTFARAAAWGERASGFDLLPERRAAMAADGIYAARDAADALADAPLVLSLVCADQALAASEAAGPHLAQGTLWCDMNSVAPETKRAAARAVEAAGGRYVDVAVMAPVEPLRLNVPLLLAGTYAQEAEAALRATGFTDLRIVGPEVGRASAIKLIRSVMVKGVEALTAEMMAAAASAGVVDEVLASLDASEKPQPWAGRADYNLERMATHGLRRAAEMEEAAKTLRSLGVEPLLTEGTVQRQRAATTRRNPTSLDANGFRLRAGSN